MKVFYSILLAFLITNCGTTKQPNFKSFGDLRPSEPGKCYAKCLVPVETEAVVIFYNRYTGSDNLDNKLVRKSNIVTQEASKGWVKKKADRNCMAPNPDDCLVWCLVDLPEESIEYFEVLDTNQVKDFVKDSLVIDDIEKATSHTEWVEVLCENDISKSIISEIQSKLLDLGYNLSRGVNGKLDKETKAELKQYQKDYQLPIGNLNIKTMEALGVY